jgi:MFS family permease
MGTMNSFFPLFLDSIGLTPFIIGAFFALLALTYAMSRFLVAGYSDRTGHKALPLALSIGGVVLAVAFLASFENILLIVLIVGVLGLCFGVSNLLQGTVVAEQADQRIRGFALGLFLSVIVAGAGAGPAVLSPVADSYGFEVAFRVNALLILTGLVTVLIAWRKANLK